MTNQESRKRILDKIREARNIPDKRIKIKTEPPVTDSRMFLDPVEELPELVFARNLVDVKGKFSYCSDQQELVEALRLLVKDTAWKRIVCFEPTVKQILDQAKIKYTTNNEQLEEAEAIITGCEYLIARTGSILVSSRQGSGRRAFGIAPAHVVLGNTSQLVPELQDALDNIKNKYTLLPSQVSLITGPSRTADIEKTLVMGAHGPKDFYVFLINDQ